MANSNLILPSIEEQRQELRDKKIIAKEYFRILHIGRYAFGKTDIVSRMKLALENLGHTVFDLNTDDFKEVIHNPDRHVGGMGPVEIKLDYIKPILRQFEPQIIICNAGGYTFSEEDSDWLKQHGYILVGITLSDPDVFVGTKNFAHRFDYHVTNAIEAIQMYKEVGITNTMHFPFAIDRSFIEVDAVEKKDWKADVICIGNATNREDRNTMMKYLDKFFNVKVYGMGWDFADSFSVGGDDFFSASRAGKFHINFPGTRAGYTNLKVGVFESIANGGILCTEYFDEMNIFFEYDKEIIGYKDAEDLKEKIAYYLEHPEEAELMRRRAFNRLINEHLWESRWEKLLDDIRNDININKSILPKERYEQVNELHGTSERAAKVIIQGYYGALNSGDDLILESISNNIKKKFPNTLIMVAGFNRKPITLQQGFYSVPRTDIFRMEKYIKQSDLLIYGGGGLLNDYTFNNSAGVPDFFDAFTHGITGMGIIPTMANIHEVPRMYFALGVGPLENPESRRFAKFLVNQMSVVTVRDKYSKDLLNSLGGINKEIIQTSDPTYMLEYPGKELSEKYFDEQNIPKNKKVLSVTLRDWNGNPTDFEERMAKYLDKLVADKDNVILFFPYQFGTGKSDDNRIHSRVQELMKNSQQTYIYKHKGDYQEFLSIIGNSHMAISMRLHGSILANLFGVPSIGFNYDNKVLAHYQNLEIDNYLLDLEFNVEHALNLYEDLEINRSVVVDKIQNNVQSEKLKSSKTFEYAIELLAEGLKKEKVIYRYFPREESLRDNKMKELFKELQQYKQENSFLKSNIRALNSTVSGVRIDNIENIDLTKATFDCQEKHFEEKDIVAARSRNRIGIRLSDLNAPKKGDFTTAKINLELDPGHEYIINLDVLNSYYKAKNKGRINYYILIDGKKVYKEDIAEDGEEKQLSFRVRPKREKVTLEFKLEALKDCERWSWGSVSKTYFSNVTTFKVHDKKKNNNLVKSIFKF